MCGICGIIDLQNTINSSVKITEMMRSIKHRGPDDEGFYIDQNIALGHVRLSIIDLSSAGHQPMFSNDENFVIAFNGEIYNYLELKNELKSEFDFKTNTDTEVLLNAYRKWGKKCLSKFNGMFSFAIYDKKNNKFFAARDRFGIKPFYYFKDESNFIFCSEIKGILASKIIKPILNEEALYDFIVFNRTDHAEFTNFKNIYNLRPGHCIEVLVDKKKFDISQWYFLPELFKNTINLSDCKAELYSKLLESTRLHLVSDVPVGSALSGGIDSSSIVSLMKEILPKDNTINAFSAVYGNNWEKDETKYINEIVKEKGLKPHFVYPDALDLLKNIDQIIYQQEEPFASASLFASWKVYQEANRSNIKVLLNGQGADEIFAYDYMAAFYFKELFVKFKWLKLIQEVFLFHKKQAASKFTIQLFLFLIAPDFLKNKLINVSDHLVNKDFSNQHKNTSTFNKKFFNSKTLNQNVENHLLLKLNHLLRIEDKNSMYFSVEGRVPFLEHQLVEYALNIPPQYKVHKGEVKYILKQSMKKLLPKLIFDRNNKIGYETPMDQWFRTDTFKIEFEKLLAEENQPMGKYLNLEMVKNKWRAHQNGKNNGSLLWKYFYLTKWSSIYFKNSL